MQARKTRISLETSGRAADLLPSDSDLKCLPENVSRHGVAIVDAVSVLANSPPVSTLATRQSVAHQQPPR